MSYRVKDQMSPRIYPWWLILVGFVVGVFVTLVVTASRPQPTIVYRTDGSDESLWQIATQLVREATRDAQSFNQSLAFPTFDEPIFATATAMSQQAAADYDPFLMTATAIVIQATQQAP